MKRSDERMVPVADATVTGPVLTALECGCVTDTIGGIWEPCPAVAAAHARACELARLGLDLPAKHRRRGPKYLRPTLTGPAFDELIDELAQHVANAKRAATLAASRQRRMRL